MKNRIFTRQLLQKLFFFIFDFIKDYAAEKRVSDATFAALKRNFTDTEIVEIIALNAFEQFYNALDIPLEIESDGLRKIAEN